MSDGNNDAGTLIGQAAGQEAGQSADNGQQGQGGNQAQGSGQGQQQQGQEQGQQQGQQSGQNAAGQEAKPAGAPEKYEFKPADGQPEFDAAVTGAFGEVAKELNLSQEAAQKVLDKMAPVLAARQTESLSAARSQWMNDSKADAEFGGEKLQENLGAAKKAIDAFATQPLKNLLEESGLGNHPEVVRLFVRVGKAIGEDGFVSGRGSSAQSQDARRLYAASNMNP